MFIDWVWAFARVVLRIFQESSLTNSISIAPKAGNKSVRVGDDGSVWIQGYRCGSCGAVMPVPTMACRRCASRIAPDAYRSPETGTLYTWSVVHRSYPGVAVPFVSAIVDLEALRTAMPVRLVFDDAGGAVDADGNPYVGFHFVAGDAA